MGFFAASTLVSAKPTVSKIPKCGSCGLYRGCFSPKMPVDGKGRKRILICAEAPGADEDEQGKPLVGRAGQHLEGHLDRVGVDMRRDCWLTNSLICRPGEGNPTPTDDQLAYCRPNLFNAIEKYQPELILCFGLPAVKSLIGHVWREDVGPMKRWAGFIIPSQTPNCWIAPTYHPSYLLRQNDPVLELHFHRHLKAAVAKQGKPWAKLPNYEQQVQCLFEPSKAARALRAFIDARPKYAAVDVETDRLKGDSTDASIICCSVSNGETTLAYPWHGDAIGLTKELITDEGIGKIASNMKFEHRWFRRILGVEVKNWAWDTMLCAHVLDNRAGITGLKFQAFVRLGQPSYDDHIRDYLHARNSNQPNRVRELDLKALLKYCGTDSLLELVIARQQMAELGYG